MTSASDSNNYRVVPSPSFRADWNAGVAAGWLNPMVHPAQLEFFIRTTFSNAPDMGEQLPGVPVNVRFFRFPRSPVSPDTIEIAYSIIEDDRTVTLERIRLVA